MHGVVVSEMFSTKVRTIHLALGSPNITASFTDNDDDGETAAGGRLAHLLQILASSVRRITAVPLLI